MKPFICPKCNHEIYFPSIHHAGEMFELLQEIKAKIIASERFVNPEPTYQAIIKRINEVINAQILSD